MVWEGDDGGKDEAGGAGGFGRGTQEVGAFAGFAQGAEAGSRTRGDPAALRRG